MINRADYTVLRLLGKGKGGYSWLVEREGIQYVLKEIHHEPCDYYSFGNKIESERNDYHKLLETGIKMPEMLDIDMEKELILKEYIEGQTVFELIREDKLEPFCVEQVREMAEKAEARGLNIDYFPTNFVLKEGVLYYIDYECNPYSEQWNFENWGIEYWSKTDKFKDYVNQI